MRDNTYVNNAQDEQKTDLQDMGANEGAMP